MRGSGAGTQGRINICVLLSGGTGTRAGTEIPKQYVRVGEHMMVTHALSTVLCSPLIDEVYVVAAPEWRDDIELDARAAGLDMSKLCGFAMPGSNRQESALNGMDEALRQKESRGENGRTASGSGDMNRDDMSPDMGGQSTVLIHDAARPLLTHDLLEKIYGSLRDHDGVMPVLPMKDTVYLSGDGLHVSELIDRSRVYAGQAPELFLFDKYYRANKALLPHRILSVNGATEPAVMSGMDVVMIPGDEGNFKVTTAEDMERYKEIVNQVWYGLKRSVGAALIKKEGK